MKHNRELLPTTKKEEKEKKRKENGDKETETQDTKLHKGASLPEHKLES